MTKFKAHPRHLLLSALLAILIASIAWAYRPDDWSRFDHRRFKVVSIESGDCVVIETSPGKTEPVKLLGIDATPNALGWLADHVLNQQVTLLLQSPQTRAASGQLVAFVFLGDENVSVELVKEGFAYADRREKTEMDGLLDLAESDARKKKHGLWLSLTFAQMPAWRQAWLRSLPRVH